VWPLHVNAQPTVGVPLSRYSLSELALEVARVLGFEHEYERQGALQYLAAWDVHRAVVFGRCEPKTGKAAFGRLVDRVMNQEPYRSARRVFWIVDNGSSHRGERAAEELRIRHASSWSTRQYTRAGSIKSSNT